MNLSTFAMGLALLGGFVLVTGEADGGARILAVKNIVNMYLVENKDLTVEYSLYNVGDSAALDVSLADNTFPTEDFELLHGQLDVKWERIAPGANVTHAAVLKPLKSGYFNFTSAEISYLASEDASEPTLGYTSGPGEGGIMAFKAFDRKFSPHILDWVAFAVMTTPSLMIPFALWYSSKSKYDNMSKSKKSL